MRLLLALLLICLLELSLAAMTSTASTKRILVTGGNKGIGKAICERLLTEWKDTHVFLCARDTKRGQDAVNDIIGSVGGDSNSIKDRLEFLLLDTSSDSSVKEAAKNFDGGELYGIINNAGVGWGYSMKDTLNTNYFGPRRVNEAFGKFLQRPGGRIVNVASASGPNYISGLSSDNKLKEVLSKPWQTSIAELDSIANNAEEGSDGYGLGKALLNAYTVIHAKLEKDLLINSCTPGFIKTDLTAGTSATNPTSKGAVPPCYLMMDESTVPKVPTGRYYGSDCIRSPIAFYRGPGEPPYESDEDLVDLPAGSSVMPSIL